MAKQKLTFEQALQKLEEIVAAIESGETGLEESIEKYAEGIELIKNCRTILDSAEKKIQLLATAQAQSTPDGAQTLEPAGELPEPQEE